MYNEETLFYILVPVYNAEKYIHHCIQSVLNQTYQNFCLVLVDDGSCDSSGNICDTYAEKDSRIQIIHQKNKGHLGALQTAAKYVLQQPDRGGLIVYLDSDDALKASALETILHVFQNENCDMVVYGLERVQDERIASSSNAYIDYVGTITDKRVLYRRVLLTSKYNSLCRKAISADLLTDTVYGNISRVPLAADRLQSLSYYEKCKKVIFIEAILYEYTVNPNSNTHSIKYETYEVNSTVQSLVWNFIQEQDVWNEQDYKEYLQYSRREMKNRVIGTIARFDTSIENKAELFDKVKKDEYYSMILETVTRKDRWLTLLKNDKYKQLIWEVRLKNKIGLLYRRLQKGR